MTAFLFLLTLAALLEGVQGVQLTGGPGDGAGDVIYTCQGGAVSLPWHVQLGPGDVIHDTEWFYQGRSEEVVGVLVHGTFLPQPAFADRVSHVDNAGIALRQLLSGDSGNYSVFVTGANASGHIFELRQSVTIEISDHLMTTDGYLHASEAAEPLRDSASGLWSVHLLCGVFTFPGNPPYFVEWITPAGVVRTSSSYDSSGYFHLPLSGAIPSGTYRCRVPEQHLNDSCLLGQDSARAEASVQLDGVTATLGLMARDMQHVSRQLQLITAHIQGDHQTFTQSIDDLRGMLNNLTASHHALQVTVEDQHKSLHTLLEPSGPCHPDNHTVIDDPRRSIGEGQGDLCDMHLSPGWYRFLLHSNSAVLPTTCVPEDHCHTVVPTWLDLQGQSLPSAGHELHARACFNWSNNCCYWQSPVTVRSCGRYYVYRLQPYNGCTVAFCVEPQP